MAETKQLSTFSRHLSDPGPPGQRRTSVRPLAVGLFAVVTLAAGCSNAATPSAGTYTVRSGDSFSAISSRTGTDMHRLAAFNGMTINSFIHPGDVLKVPGSGSGTSTATPAKPKKKPAAPSSFGQRLAFEAQRHVGKRYAWGATGPNTFDCSGLVVYSYAQAGRTVPRYSSKMMASRATRVAKSNMRPGDLVFVYSPVSHMGIYVGNNQIVHASNQRTGVKMSSLSSYSRVTWFAGRL